MDRSPLLRRTPVTRSSGASSSSSLISWGQVVVILGLSTTLIAISRRGVSIQSALHAELATANEQISALENQVVEERRSLAVANAQLQKASTDIRFQEGRAKEAEGRLGNAEAWKLELDESRQEVGRVKAELESNKAAWESEKAALAEETEDRIAALEKVLAEERARECSEDGVIAASLPVPEEMKPANERSLATWQTEVFGRRGDRWRKMCTSEKLVSYLDYVERGECPDDWPLVQDLIFIDGCYALPRRKCFAAVPPDFTEPAPFPSSLWIFPKDEQIRWTHHSGKSMSVLKNRQGGDCSSCFDPSREVYRWKLEPDPQAESNWTVTSLVMYKKGSLRVGLDIGGGTGTFAAKMAALNVTIITTMHNWRLPFLETIALRGLLALHIPRSQRLPFFDNSLDIVHAASSIKYSALDEFEHMLFDWDRVLRPGGVVWLENFYGPSLEMPKYLEAVEALAYKKLEWTVNTKASPAEIPGEHLSLRAVLEKPLKRTA